MPERPVNTPYVFISYASRDRPGVIGIVDALESDGIDVWFDREDIPGGTSYGPEIVSGIKNAVALVLMCSEASLASRNVRQEIQLAWRHERPILPLLLEPLVFPDDVAYWLEGAQWIEVLDHGPDAWLDQVRYALALMGYRGIQSAPVTPAAGELVDLPPNNLPVLSGPLIGRERELRQVKSLLGNCRLLTLTGPGGTGKTRLAEEVARESAANFPDGIWFVDAASARDSATLAELIASVLQVHETPEEQLTDEIVAAIRGKRLLLILDNLEQVSNADAFLDSLLQDDVPTALATSRSPTRSRHELAIPVAPLDATVPDPDTPASVIGRTPAVQLFVSRARQVKPDFQLSDGNALEVATICAKLDGLPLAIELAAARSRLLHPAALLERLQNRLDILTRGTGRSARHETLLATLAWSHDLLTPKEQEVFRRAGVFAGGLTVEAAEEVIPALTGQVEPNDVLDCIDSLIDHSLLEVDRSNRDSESSRVRMLESVRDYANRLALDYGETQALAKEHGAYFVRFAEELEPELERGQQAIAIQRLLADYANLTTALENLVELADDQERGLALRLAAALWRFWWMGGKFSEGSRLLRLALAVDSSPDSPARARALNGAGVMVFSLGDMTEAGRLHEAAAQLSSDIGLATEEARSLDYLGIVALVTGDVEGAARCFNSALDRYRVLDDRRGIATVLDHLTAAAHAAGDFDQARGYSAECLAESRKLGDQHGIGQSLQQLGVIELYMGNYEEARDLFEQALVLAESQGDPQTLATALLNLGSATELQGQLEAAEGFLLKSLELYTEANDLRNIGYAHYMLGHLARQQGEAEKARRKLAEGLRLLESSGQRDAVALCLETLAGASIDLGEFELAATLLGGARSIRDEIGIPVPATRTDELQRDTAALRTALGGRRYRELLEAEWTGDPGQALGRLLPVPGEATA